MMENEGLVRYQASRRTAMVGMATNFLLSVAQVVIGFFGHSQALIADGMHTLSDLFSDVLVLFAAKHGAKDADEDHPYGHGRIETAATLLLSAILTSVGLGIAINAGMRLVSTGGYTPPSAVTLVVALFTLASKEALYRYTVHVARRLRSNLLLASAWHHRSDAFSSIIVAVGIGGSLLGWRFFDAAAAIAVAVIIVKMGIGIGWRSVKELVDTGLDAERLRRVREIIKGVNGVRALHSLRSRHSAGKTLVDVHILVDPTLSVSEGHHISENVRFRLMQGVEDVSDVMVHIDAEDDEMATPTVELPLRDVLAIRLFGYFRDIPEAGAIEDIELHYLDGKVQVELLLPLSVLSGLDEAERLRDRFRTAASVDHDIGLIDVRYH